MSSPMARPADTYSHSTYFGTVTGGVWFLPWHRISPASFSMELRYHYLLALLQEGASSTS